MTWYYWYFPLSALINAVTSSALAIYILIASYRKPIARYLFLFCFSVAVWSFGYFFWQLSGNANTVVKWVQVLMLGAIFTSTTFLHFVIVSLGFSKARFYKFVVVTSYLFSGLWVVADLSGQLVGELRTEKIFQYWPTAGTFFDVFLVSFVFQFLYALTLLFLNISKTSDEAEKKSRRLLFLGTLVGLIGGATNFPLWYGIQITPWGNIFVSAFVITTVFAIMRYKFLDARVVFAEFFSAVLFIILLADALIGDKKSMPEFILRIAASIIIAIFGIILVKLIYKAISQHEEVLQLASTLKETNTELAQTNAQLKELDKQKTEFLTIAAHQLRTPLSIIKGYISLLSEGSYGKLKHEVKTVLKNMDESNQWLIRLADEFLSIARLEQGRTKYTFAPTDLRAIIESILAELSAKAEPKGLELAWAKPRSAQVAEIDDEKIRYTIFNLVDNAIKYCDKGKIVVACEGEDDGWKVTVSDKGIGFDEHDQANFFQKFYRGQNVHTTNVNGTGLGLYVCSRFIHGHHGRIWATSDGLGKGSEFGFWIPAKASPVAITGDSAVSAAIPQLDIA